MTDAVGRSQKVEKWVGRIPESDLDTYRKATFGTKIGIGRRPALLNIDTTYMFIDPAYPQCGRAMPEMIANVTALTDCFRNLNLPIYYSRRDDRNHPVRRGIWNHNITLGGGKQYTQDPRADAWPEEFGPRENDVIIYKNKPSAFFETPLESFLRYDQVDSLVVVGVSTSGCVRAAVTDGFSHNFRVIVASDACGDRSESSHWANLFDMDMKFSDVELSRDIIAYLTANESSLIR